MAETITAVRIHDYGGPEAVRIERAPRPGLDPDQVLVQVRAAGVNPVDWKVRDGLRRDRMPLPFPAVLGCDVSGVVVEAGPSAGGLEAGDAVFAMTGLFGAFSELVAIKASYTAAKPASLDHVHAAAVPLAALTAWQAFELAGLSKGQKVLVTAGAGGVGGFAVQIAAALGARVTATASTGKLDYVRSLGAETVVDYRTTAFEEVLSDFDVVFDLLGGETQARAWKVLKPGGFLVSSIGVPPDEETAALGVKAARVGVRPNGAQLQAIADLIDQGRIKVHVEATYPLAQASEAIERVRQGHTRGKVVLVV